MFRMQIKTRRGITTKILYTCSLRFRNKQRKCGGRVLKTCKNGHHLHRISFQGSMRSSVSPYAFQPLSTQEWSTLRGEVEMRCKKKRKKPRLESNPELWCIFGSRRVADEIQILLVYKDYFRPSQGTQSIINSLNISGVFWILSRSRENI